MQSDLFQRLSDILNVGGPVVSILILMSIAVLTITIVKIMQMRAARVGDTKTAREGLNLYLAGHSAEALQLLEKSPNPISQALLRAIVGQRRDLPENKVREEITRYATDALEALKSWFRPLEVIASLAPLLGLLGTVMGMITAFQQLEAAGNQVDPSILSGGIWEALLTTAVGLTVAIPTVVILNWLERKVERLASEMESTVTRAFTEELIAPNSTEYKYELDTTNSNKALAR